MSSPRIDQTEDAVHTKDQVFLNFLESQWEAARALQPQTDLVELAPRLGRYGVPDRYLATFYCSGLVRNPGGEVVEATRFDVGIRFPEDYVRGTRCNVLTMLGPVNVYHPNILGPALCAGPIAPGTGLIDLLYRVFDILTFQNWAPHDGLNPDACQWARNHQDRFPVDRRPLKWKAPVAAAVREGGTEP
jgi:hypothetical protein